MSAPLPERVDPWRLADQGGTLDGRYPLADMPRLAPLLVDAAGEVRFVLRFERDENRRAVIKLAVDAVLKLTCQRCLAPLDVVVCSRSTLGIVASIDEAQRLPDAYESLLVGEASVLVRDLVEEELLLAVPAVPRHDEPCSPEGVPLGEKEKDGGEPSASPFAVLASLRERRLKD